MNVRVVGIAVAVVLSVSACGGGADSGSSSDSGAAAPTAAATSAAPVTFETLLGTQPLTTTAICADYEAVIKPIDTFVGKALVSGQKVVDDAYRSASYRDKVKWVDEDYVAKLGDAMKASATTALNTVSNGRAGELDDISGYLDASVAACGLTAKYEAAQESAAELNALAEDIDASADSKPWYPRGYFEIVDGFAGKWVDGSDPCGYGPLCWYWHLSVVSEEGCPEGVYVEVNFTQDGTAIDWSNDTLPALRPMQKGRMPFYTYERSADSIEIADVSCHQ